MSDPKEESSPSASGPAQSAPEVPGGGKKESPSAATAKPDPSGTSQTFSDNKFEQCAVNIYGYRLDRGESLHVRRRPFADQISHDQLEAFRKDWQIDDALLERICDILAQHRFVVLSGRPELGKACLGLAALGQFMSEMDMAALPLCRVRNFSEYFPFEPDQPDIGIDLSAGGGIVLKDALDDGNQDLRRILALLDGPAARSLTEKLNRANLLLIMTGDTEILAKTLAGAVDRLRGLGMLVDITPPTIEALARTFKALAERTGVSMTPSCDQETLKKLETHPRVVRFFDGWVAAVRVANNPSVHQVIESMDNAPAWLESLRKLPDQAAWHAILALLLGLSVAKRDHVPWNEFYDLLQEVATALTPAAEHAKGKVPVTPDLGLIRAEFRTDDDTSSSRVVAFKQVRDGETLWKAFLNREPVAATRLLRHFLARAASKDDDAPVSNETRRLAAQAAGKLCTLDPAAISFHMQSWLGEEPEKMYLLGHLLQGIGASRNQPFHERSLKFLQQPQSPEIMAGVLMMVLPIISQSDFDGALTVLQAIIGHGLRKDISNLSALNKGIKGAESLSRMAREAGDLREVTYFSQFHQILMDNYFLIGDGNFLLAVRECLAFLCFLGGGVETMHQLFAKTRHVHPLLAGLFIGPSGVVRRAAEYARMFRAESGNRPRDPFLLSLKSRNGTVEQFMEVLVRIDTTIEFFPKEIRRHLRSQLTDLVRHWISIALADSHLSRKLAQLFRKIIAHTDSVLAHDLKDYLSSALRNQHGKEAERRLALQALR